MGSTLYFQCFSGISGDMCLGALIDAGVPKDFLMKELGKMSLTGYHLDVTSVQKKGIGATKVVIAQDAPQYFRHLPDIEKIIVESSLSEYVKNMSLSAFYKLAEAEAKVHQTSVDKIHFHEVGALDAIVDVVGTFIGVEFLNPTQIISSPLTVGGGYVKCAHGILPVPAPATLELLKGIPLDNSFTEGELVTPTGAAIITTLTTRFTTMPSGKVAQVGYGAGSKDLAHPNVLRIMMFSDSFGQPTPSISHGDQIGLLETNVDDMTGESLGFLMEQLFQVGATDCYYTPMFMKKNRPAYKVSIIFPLDSLKSISNTLFLHSSTFGARLSYHNRITLNRSFQVVDTNYGPVRVKLGFLDNTLVRVAPEYDDCAQLARDHNLPIDHIFRQALALYHNGNQ